jgi:guanosine-3',5'-bis(diphosphate) 3'-pyrophosphohydrolase
MNDTLLPTAAAIFGARKHIDGRRKGAQQEPYINHPLEVGALVAEFTNGTDPVLVAAAYLHDTLEDTETTYEELVREFGENVADIVREVSDDPSLSTPERKLAQIENAPHLSDRAKMVRIADKVSNLRSTLESPPVGWSDNRKLEYFIWAKAVVDNCRGISRGLEARFDGFYARGVKTFQPKP